MQVVEISKQGKVNFGKQLRKYRLKNDINQKQLGLALGFAEGGSQKAISRYESGEVFPNAAKLSKIAQLLNVNMSDLLVYPSSEPVKTNRSKKQATRNPRIQLANVNSNVNYFAHEQKTTPGIICKKLGISHSNLYNLDKSNTVKYLIKTSQYLDTSLDKLAGRVNGKTIDPGLYYHIRKIANERKISIRSIENKYGMPIDYLRKLDKQKNVSVLLKLADYFKISLDELINRGNAPKKVVPVDPDVEKELNRINNRNKLGDRITEIARSRNFSIPALMATVNSDEETFNHLTHDSNIELLSKMATQLSVTIEELIGKKILLDDSKLNNLNKQVKEAQTKLNDLNKQSSSNYADLTTVNEQIKNAQNKLTDLSKLIQLKAQELSDLQNESKKEQDKLNDLKQKAQSEEVNYKQAHQKNIDEKNKAQINTNQTVINHNSNNDENLSTPLKRLLVKASSLNANQILTIQDLIEQFANLNQNK